MLVVKRNNNHHGKFSVLSADLSADDLSLRVFKTRKHAERIASEINAAIELCPERVNIDQYTRYISIKRIREIISELKGEIK